MIFIVAASPSQAQNRHGLHGFGSVHPGVAQSQPVGRLAATEQLELAISLPLQNQDQIDAFIQNLYDPAGPNYHHYLTVAEFTETFGPTKADYDTVIGYLQAHGFTITQTHPNRMIVDVKGSIANIESTFHVKMQRYQHPTENRTFYGSDAEPSLDQDLPILDISGLDNFALPHPKNLQIASGTISKATGSGPGGLFRGRDFRSAYCPQVTLDGTGQTIGLFQFGSYYPNDIANYCSQSGLPSAQITQVLLDGASGTPASGDTCLEESLDIEMVHALAPGANIYFYTGNSAGNAADIWNRIATDNIAKQVSSSWSASPPPSTLNQILQQMASQGQSVFNASGDGGYSGSPFGWDDNPYMTSVGGTELVTSGANGPWSSETGATFSGGYISPNFAIPSWQQGISMAANDGSTSQRNCPDVSMASDQIWCCYNNGGNSAVYGTSAASPLWAAYMALVNQQAAANGKATAGFINPTVYALGEGSSYTANFHDITSGNNGKLCVSGYDLVTGWGSPLGQSMINYLSGAQVNPTYFVIINKNSGKCLDLASGSLTNGTILQQWSVGPNANQLWALLPTEGNAHFKIIAWSSGKCESIVGDSLNAGAQLQQWDYVGNDAGQQYDLVDKGNGWFNIKNVNSGLVVDVTGAQTTNGTPIQQWTANGTDAQLWRLQPWGNYFIRSQVSGRYLYAQGGGTANGTRVVQYDWANNSSYIWNFANTTDGWYACNNQSSATPKAISVNAGSTSPGMYTQLWDYNNAPEQQSRIVPRTDGLYRFYFKHDGQSWDIMGAYTTNNTPLTQYTDNGTAAQLFQLQRVP